VKVWPADAAVSLSYVAEAERFLAFVRDGAAPPVDGARGLRSLALAERIRAAAR
jgi:predicted dehydrogenase